MGNRQGSNKNKKKEDKKKERDAKKAKGKKKPKNRNSAAISERDSVAFLESSEDIAQGACAQPGTNTTTNSNHTQPDVLAGITFDPATRPRDHSGHGAWSSDEESQLGYSTPLLRTPKTQRSAHVAAKSGDLSSGEHLQEIPKFSELVFAPTLSSSPGEVRLRHKSESLSPASSPALSRGDVKKKRALGQAVHENGSSKAIEAAIFSAPQLRENQNGGQATAKKGTPEINIFGDDRDSLEDTLCPWLRDDDTSIDEEQLDDMFISCIDLSYNMADACSEKEFTGGSEADFSSLETKSKIKDRKEPRKQPAAAPSCYGEWEGSSVDPMSCKDETQKTSSGYKPQASPVVKVYHYQPERNKTESERQKVQQYDSEEHKSKTKEGKAKQQNELEKFKSDYQKQIPKETNQSGKTKATEEREAPISYSPVDNLRSEEAAGSFVDGDELTHGISVTETRGSMSAAAVKQHKYDSSENIPVKTQPIREEGEHNKQNEAATPTKKNGRARERKRKKYKTKNVSRAGKSVEIDSYSTAEKDNQQVSEETGESESMGIKREKIEEGAFNERTTNDVTVSVSAGTSECVDPAVNSQHRFIGDGQTPADFAASVMSSMSEAPAPFSVDPNPPCDPQPMSKLVQRITGFIKEETIGITRDETSVVGATRRRRQKHTSRTEQLDSSSGMTSDAYSQELDSVFLSSDKTNSQTSFGERLSQSSPDVKSRLPCTFNTEAELEEDMNTHIDEKDGPYEYNIVTAHSLITHTQQTSIGSPEVQESRIEPSYTETQQCEQYRSMQYSDTHGSRTIPEQIHSDLAETATPDHTHGPLGPVSLDDRRHHISQTKVDDYPNKPNIGDYVLGALPSKSELGNTLPGATVAESHTSISGSTGEGISKAVTQGTDNGAGMSDRENPDVQAASGNTASTSSSAVPPPSPSAMDALQELDEEAEEEDIPLSDQKSKEIQLFGDSVLKRLSYLVENQGSDSDDEEKKLGNKTPVDAKQGMSEVVGPEEESHRGVDTISSVTGPKSRTQNTTVGDTTASLCEKDTKSSNVTAPSKMCKENPQSDEEVIVHLEKDVRDTNVTPETQEGMSETMKVISHETSRDADNEGKDRTHKADKTSKQKKEKTSPELETVDDSKQDMADSLPASDKKGGKRKGRSKKAKAKAKAKKLQANANDNASEKSECKSEQPMLAHAIESQSRTEHSEYKTKQTLKSDSINKSTNENSKLKSQQTLTEIGSPKVVVKRPKIPEELTHVACCSTDTTETTTESNSDSNPKPPKRESQQITEVIDAYGDAVDPVVDADKIKALNKDFQQTCSESVSDACEKTLGEQKDTQRPDSELEDIHQKKTSNTEITGSELIHQKKASNPGNYKKEGSKKVGSKSKSNPSKKKRTEEKEAQRTVSKPQATARYPDSAGETQSEKLRPDSTGSTSRKETSDQKGDISAAGSVGETENVIKPKYVENEKSADTQLEVMSGASISGNNKTADAPVTVTQSSPQEVSDYSDFVDINVTECPGVRSEHSTGDTSDDQSPNAPPRPQVLALQRVTYDNDQTEDRESRASWELSDDLDTTEESFENLDFPAERQSSSSADSVFRIPAISETFGEMDSVKNILDDFEDRTPQAESMPYIVEKDLLKSQPDFLTVHRRSRMSPALTNRTESDLDISEMRDDISTDSMYADDEEDGPLLFTKSYTEQSGGGVLMSCTIYNSSHNRHDDSDDFWEDCVDEAYHQIEVSADAATSTFQDARKQMHEIHEHLRTLRLQMESLADDLENASITPDREFRTESDDKRLVTD